MSITEKNLKIPTSYNPQAQSHMSSLEFFQIYKKEMIATLHKILHVMEKEEHKAINFMRPQ